ncbi:phosphatase PAP2 family protein [Lactococcus protaetiae]|uniref:phosphatase PAP2 family protein n=1 Tax=Lactococcus protaetiae TaxID=2592653 RepID=UPI001CC1EDAE|nr:phosphatase PAP2 family protein [Lactococcus protaetiae]
MNKKISYSIGVISGILFIILMVWVKLDYTQIPLSFDGPIQNLAFQLQNSSILTHFFTAYTNLFGDTGGIITAALVALLLFFLLKQKIGGLWFAGLTVLGTGFNTLVKDVIGRSRPDIHRLAAFAHQSGKSFASGHSVFATILFGSLFLIYFTKLKTRSAKLGLAGLVLLLTVLVMFSRVFVGYIIQVILLVDFLKG